MRHRRWGELGEIAAAYTLVRVLTWAAVVVMLVGFIWALVNDKLFFGYG